MSQILFMERFDRVYVRSGSNYFLCYLIGARRHGTDTHRCMNWALTQTAVTECCTLMKKWPIDIYSHEQKKYTLMFFMSFNIYQIFLKMVFCI